jgi:UDP-N-acetylglucosamine--N-acetylmuramyl-(pentapeptide) pyrophosphoryl-undecaprenol N-acetylglucosamine transferase
MGETGVKTLMIAGGGTGGHIYPAIAIAREFVARDASRKVVFVGTQRVSKRTSFRKPAFRSSSSTSPDSKECAASISCATSRVCRSASSRPGSTSAAIAPTSSSASAAIHPARCSSPRAARHPDDHPRSERVPGLRQSRPRPLDDDRGGRVRRRAAAHETKRRRRHRQSRFAKNSSTSASGRQPTTDNRNACLIFGGSQGSRVLNDAMTGALLFLARLKDRWRSSIRPVRTSSRKCRPRIGSRRSRTRASCRTSIRSPTRSRPPTSSSSRAGAMTIGELAAIGRGAILVPFAAATNNHQELNARVVEKAGGAVVITEAELSPERLAGAISEVLADPQRAERMGIGGEAARHSRCDKKHCRFDRENSERLTYNFTRTHQDDF